jgi:hypothetical protein
MSEELSIDESRDLLALEAVVCKGQKAFLEVGEALAEIRDRRLYRVKFSSFDEYLDRQWGMSRSKACRLISASATAKLLPVGNTVKAESVMRPFKKLRREHVKAAYLEAVKAAPNGVPRAQDVEAAVRGINGVFSRPKAKKKRVPRRTLRGIDKIVRRTFTMDLDGVVRHETSTNASEPAGLTCTLQMDVASAEAIIAHLRSLVQAVPRTAPDGELRPRCYGAGGEPVPNGDIRPTKAGIVLGSLPEELRAGAWQEAVRRSRSGKPSAALVRSVVERMTLNGQRQQGPAQDRMEGGT